MKKSLAIFCFFVLAAMALTAQARAGGTMYAAISNLELKASTGFFASVTGTLNYGAPVTVIRVQGDWAEVRASSNASISGWAKLTSLSARRIVEGDTTSASAREVALAGKGFNQEVENSYRASGTLNYADVDWVETLAVSNDALLRFIREGRLSAGE